MKKRTAFGVTLVALVALRAIPSATANCLSIRNATTFGSATAYWIPAGPAGTLTGQTWQLGNPGAWSTGNCNTNSAGPGGAMVYFSGPGANLNLDMGACGNGCPASLSTLAVLTQNKYPGGADFMLDTIVETPANPSANFDYGSQGDHSMIPIPKPRVVSSSHGDACGAPNALTLTVAVDSIASGLYGPNAASAVSGFRILWASGADPGSDPAAYTLRASVPSPGGAPATTTLCGICETPTFEHDEWLVTQLAFEGGVLLSDAVSVAVRIRCRSLAEPNPRIGPKRIGAPKSDAPTPSSP